VFFDAPHFKRQLLAAANTGSSSPQWMVLDMLQITMIDATGLETVQELTDELGNRGIIFVAAGRKTEWILWAAARGFEAEMRKTRIYSTLDSAISGCQDPEQVSTDR
jgi:MFS superfamily sulfate permease-like transporter